MFILYAVIIFFTDESRYTSKQYEDRFVQELMSMHVSPILHHTTLSEKNWYAILLLVPMFVLLVLKDSHIFV